MTKEAKEAFSGSRLRIARTFNGWTQAELGERVGVNHQYIAQIERDKKKPAILLTEVLSAACGFENSFFSGPELDEFRDEECHFRRRQTTPVAIRSRVLSHGTLFGQFIAFLEKSLDIPPMNFPEHRIRNREDIERAAELCRIRWGLGQDLPIKNMTRVIENAGGVVTRFKGEEEKIDAFSRSGTRALIVLNTDKRSSVRSRFDLSHEAGHLVMHQGLNAGNPELEKEADYFGGAFLLPRSGFMREFPKNATKIDWNVLFRLKKRWGVSISAQIRRAYDLTLIDASIYQRAYKYMAAAGWLKNEPWDLPEEAPEIVPSSLAYLAKVGMDSNRISAHLEWKPITFFKVVGVFVSPKDKNKQGVVVSLDLKRTVGA